MGILPHFEAKVKLATLNLAVGGGECHTAFIPLIFSES